MANESVATAEDYAYIDFDPAFDVEQLGELEEYVRKCGMVRRVAFALLAMSKKDMVSAFEKDAESVDGLLNCYDDIAGYIAHLKSQIEVMETCRLRILGAASTIEIEKAAIAGTETRARQ